MTPAASICLSNLPVCTWMYMTLAPGKYAAKAAASSVADMTTRRRLLPRFSCRMGHNDCQSCDTNIYSRHESNSWSLLPQVADLYSLQHPKQHISLYSPFMRLIEQHNLHTRETVRTCTCPNEVTLALQQHRPCCKILHVASHAAYAPTW